MSNQKTIFKNRFEDHKLSFVGRLFLFQKAFQRSIESSIRKVSRQPKALLFLEGRVTIHVLKEKHLNKFCNSGYLPFSCLNSIELSHFGAHLMERPKPTENNRWTIFLQIKVDAVKFFKTRKLDFSLN